MKREKNKIKFNEEELLKITYGGLGIGNKTMEYALFTLLILSAVLAVATMIITDLKI